MYRFFRSIWNDPHILERVELARFNQAHPIILPTVPTEEEKQLIRKLRDGIKALPKENIDSAAPSAERKWRSFKNELRRKILEDDPRKFLSWDIVRGTMGGNLTSRDYRTLSRFPFWKDWARKIDTIRPTYQRPYFKMPTTDGTTLYHAFNLAQLRTRQGTDVTDVDYIIDFGAGYGSMCALVQSLGFSGTYVLFDWPEFLLLQKFYLSLHKVDLSQIKFVSTLDELQQLKLSGDGLLIATWSLSETSLNFRTAFLREMHPKYYLLAYQLEFAGIDNLRYFHDFAKSNPEVIWDDYPVFNFTGAGNHYLLGVRQKMS